MASPPVGLDITPTAITAVSLKRRGKGYVVVKHAEAPLEPGIVGDGEVIDVERLAAAIKAMWSENGIGDKTVALGVANQRCITRVVEKVKIKGGKKQLRAALEFDVAENLSIPLEEAVWDFHTVETWKNPETGTDMQRHVVVMVYRDMVEKFRDAAIAAGLKPVRIDLSAFALMRAGMPGVLRAIDLEGSDSGEPPIVGLLDVGPTHTNIAVARGGVCEFNRTVPFGTDRFAKTLVEQFAWTPEDAARVTEEAGIVPLGGMETPGDPYADARRVLQYVADQFAGDIRTTFDYYQHASGNRIGRIVIGGDGARLRGLEMRFHNELGIPAAIMDVTPRLDAASVEQLGATPARYGTAIGLALEEAA